MQNLPTLDDVRDAASRLAGLAVLTPLVRCDALDAAAGGRVFIKAECLQRTGSFKFRGAYNRISRLTDDEKIRGVVAVSSGNHAQGVGQAAKLVGCPAVIVMPADAPRVKLEATRGYGAEVVLYDRANDESREVIAAQIVKERRAVYVSPFEDRYIIAGQGTCGLEIVQQMDQMKSKADVVLVPTSGGGLLAGVAIAVKALSPGTNVYSVEPAGLDDYAKSIAAGKRVAVPLPPGGLCDSLKMPIPGEMSFAVNQSRVTGGVAVSDDEVLSAMKFAFRHLKIVIEPGGAVGLAAVLTGKLDVKGKTTVIVASGGNVDAEVFARAIS